MRSYGIVFIFLFLLSTAVIAQDTTALPGDSATEQKQPIPTRETQRKPETRLGMPDTKERSLQEKRSEIKTDMKDAKNKRAETRALIKENFKERVMKAREEKKEEMKIKRDEFKAKLETLKDEKKKAIVERVDTKLTTINTQRTDNMSAALDKMASFLDRLRERVTAAQTAGRDVTALETAIAEAEAAIAAAQTAVANQAGKTYTATITDEITLKNNVGSVTSQLQSDLKTTHQTMISAKQSLEKALMEAKKLQ